MHTDRLIPLFQYQVTTLLLTAAKETGLTFDIDADLEAGEFIILPDDPGHSYPDVEIEGVRLSSATPFETVCSFVSMIELESFGPVLGFLAGLPFIRRLVWTYLCNRTARRFARQIGLGKVVYWG